MRGLDNFLKTLLCIPVQTFLHFITAYFSQLCLYSNVVKSGEIRPEMICRSFLAPGGSMQVPLYGETSDFFGAREALAKMSKMGKFNIGD